MARYLPEAAASVLGQSYAPVEYLVYDGGSEDGTQDLLAGYGSRLAWVSRPDAGAADALRQAFDAARGEYLGWVNADDTLAPGMLDALGAALDANPGAVLAYGDALWVDDSGHPIGPYPVAAEARSVLWRECAICQPACLFRAAAYRQAGGIDPSLHWAFDYDLWIRLARLGEFVHVPGVQATSRMHRTNKTLAGRGEGLRECASVIRRHYGYLPFAWTYALRCHARDRRDQFFEPLQPSLVAVLESVVEGAWINLRHPLRFLSDCASSLTPAGLVRHLRRLAR
jgi:glycosyltransferase involved in cell wall biosynthesis